MDLAGKVVIVTGAASGIGREAALRMGKAGAAIAIVDVNEEGARRTAQDIEAGGSKTLVLRADQARPTQVQAAIRRAADAFGRLDALANVAAIYPASEILEVTEEFWDRLLAIDLKGVFFACQEALKIMLAQGHGAIVNVASAAAFRARRGQVVYSAAKGGVVAMSRVMAQEGLRKGVRVNVVAPGPTDTPTIRGTFAPEHFQAFGARTAPGRWIQPTEVAAAIHFLCSDAASGINGAVIVVSAGDYMP